ncbi:ethylene-responsive transcription factor-like protein At4g13040 isoform X3 [Zingiber officinale]|nr:ethylene-responsive transcription factor-like protein At4g13040 [Zingiber officinale]XP_042382791.1 ethylene-responsive transcription factor-like protein At4g13040 isoform X3 [Zingiber officinale]XP_042382792.1 ethylene-responsive transcription factor-like protein At4g13040 isoform X3 [Zingiber officinale]
MVSIRRRRYLGICSGKGSSPVVVPKHIEIPTADENSSQHVKTMAVHSVPSVETSLQNLVSKSEIYTRSMDESSMIMSKEEPNPYYPGKDIKHGKRHRRKHNDNQEPCMMRGVYFKNMKWQAAIKVDKKQIHLGTVGSQEEAARLYDRAAFMCGREPNFELLAEEKQELRQYNWEEFLTMTRSAINNKKNQRRLSPGKRKKPSEAQISSSSNWEQEGGSHDSSMSDDNEDIDANVSVL